MKKYTLLAAMTASTLVWNCKPDQLIDNAVKSNLAGARVATQSAPVKQWDATYGGVTTVTQDGRNQLVTDDNFTTAAALADGGIILGGTSNTPLSGNKSHSNIGGTDFWLINLDKNGEKRGEANIGSTGNDDLSSILSTNDGGYLLGGSSDSPANLISLGSVELGYKDQDSRGRDFWVIKLNSLGARQWDITAGGTGDESLSAMVPTADGGYLLGGTTNSSADTRFMKYGIYNGTKGSTDYWIMKVDANGKKQWDQSYGTAGTEELYNVIRTTDGGFLLVGRTGGYEDIYMNGRKVGFEFKNSIWIVKIDGNGNQLWDKTIKGNSTSTVPEDAIATADGGFLLGSNTSAAAGNDQSQSTQGQTDYWVIKLDSRGNKVWDKTIGTSSQDYLGSLTATPDGGYLIGGTSTGAINGNKTEANRGPGYGDFWIVKINAQGEILWDKTAGSNRNDFLVKVLVMADGGILAAGNSDSNTGGDKTQGCYNYTDYWAIKFK